MKYLTFYFYFFFFRTNKRYGKGFSVLSGELIEDTEVVDTDLGMIFL